MSIKLKHYPLILITLALLIGILAMPAIAAEDNYRELPSQKNIHPDKANWTLEFSLPLAPQTLTDQNIYIIKQENQTRHSIKLELSQDQKKVYIIPQTPYALNSTYRLYIEAGLCSNTEPAIYFTQKSVMNFTTLAKINSSDTSITSSKYTINISSASIINVPNNTDASIFKSNITPATGATIEVYQSDKTTVRKGNIISGDVLIVCAEDQITKKAYQITVLSIVGGGGGGGTPGNGNNPGGDNQLDKEVLEDLKVVSAGLEKAINQLSDEEEKAVVRTVKNNIDRKIADPSFDHTAQIDEVRMMYSALTPEQKENVQDAILYNVSVQRLMRLAEFFGFKSE